MSLTLGLQNGSNAAPTALEDPLLAANSHQESRNVDILQALGAEARENNDWATAEDYLLRAQYQLHREFGVTTLKQRPIIDALANLSVQSENYQKANQLFEFSHFVSHKTSKPNDRLEADTTLARWYLQSGQYERAAALLEPFEADDFKGTHFVPERALLRLDVARFSRRCCSAKEIMETTQQAQIAGLPTDSLEQFMQVAAQLLIMSGHSTDAAPYLQSAAMNQNAPPTMISGKRRISARDPNRELSLIEQRKIEQQLRLNGIGSNPFKNEQLWNQRPNTVTITSSDEFLPIERPEPSENGSSRHFHTLTGDPLRFRQEDLKRVLPAEYRKKTNLESLEIIMVFTITTEGRIRNIKFDGSYDRQIRALMRDTLRAVRFQPELKDGKPVVRENYRLVQNFRLRGEA